jgi:hypothetical protein
VELGLCHSLGGQGLARGTEVLTTSEALDQQGGVVTGVAPGLEGDTKDSSSETASVRDSAVSTSAVGRALRLPFGPVFFLLRWSVVAMERIIAGGCITPLGGR